MRPSVIILMGKNNNFTERQTDSSWGPFMKKQKKWLRFRHRVVRNIAYVILYPYSRIKYGITVDKFTEQEKRPYLVLLNHQTPFDQFFAGMSFKGPIYYLATEDIFSKGWISSLIRWLVAPIPIKKQATDISAVMNCIRVAKEGGTICIAPEGNRTYSGRTEYMSPTIAPLAKKLKLPIVLYRIEGGYGAQPRWSDGVRKGKMHSYVHRVIQPEEYGAMTNEELMQAIETGLFVDEAVADGCFEARNRAQYLERAVYVCPYCGLSVFESHGHEVKCTKCERIVRYERDKRLTGVGYEFPFDFVGPWYDYQKDFVNALDTREYVDTPMYRDRANVLEVIVYKEKRILQKDAAISLYGDRVVVNEGTDREMRLPFEEVTAVSVLGRNKLNIYHDHHVYQFKGDKRFNALKYVNIYYRHKNIIRGDENGQFLGL